MGRKRSRYTAQYRQEAVRFWEETGRPLSEVAAELKVSEQSLSRWRKKYGTSEALPASDAEELRRLRRENEILRQEREFLKKAAAYFANPAP